MSKNNNRRRFVKSLLLSPSLCSMETFVQLGNKSLLPPPGKGKLKISLNAYSFNAPLVAKTMTLEELLDYCAAQNFDGVDLTGYYFPGYPTPPPDEYLFHIKRKAHALGVSISGTGIRNDFTQPDKVKRNADVQLVKQWIEVAAKLGAPVLRIFSGAVAAKGHTRKEVTDWMVADINACVAYGRRHGVIVALQNHNDFIQTAEEAIEICKMINSEWFGLVLDIGSFGKGDPYEQIRQTIPYAVNWQIKENLLVNGREEKTGFKKIIQHYSCIRLQGIYPD